MTIRYKESGNWYPVSPNVLINGEQKQTKGVWQKVGGEWEQVHRFSPLHPMSFHEFSGFKGGTVVFESEKNTSGDLFFTGSFNAFDGVKSNNLVKMSSDLKVDKTFAENIGTGPSGTVRKIGLLSNGKILLTGPSSFNGSSTPGVVMLNSDGTIDTSFMTNIGTGFSSNLVYDVLEDSSQKILICGSFSSFNGNTRNNLLRLNADGTEDTLFYQNLGSGFDGPVFALDKQSDGKILVGGNFENLNLDAGPYSMRRLNTDGTTDGTFSSSIGAGFINRGFFGDSPADVLDILVQSDDKILIGGRDIETFNTNTGIPDDFFRLNADGTEDTAFNANLSNESNVGLIRMGPSNSIIYLDNSSIVKLNSDGTEDTSFPSISASEESILVQDDGKIVVVGSNFPRIDGVSTHREAFVRINTDGTEDYDYPKPTIEPVSIQSFAVDSNDNMFVISQQTTYGFGANETSFGRILKLNSNGAVDTTFQNSIGAGFDSYPAEIAINSSDDLLIGGAFSTYDNTSVPRFAKILQNGTLDTSFNSNLGTGFDNTVFAIAVQSDGKILVGGDFTSFNGNTRNRLVRLNSNGTEDTSFVSNLGSGFDSRITHIKVQQNNQILVGGSFSTFNNNTRNSLVRLNADGTEDTVFYSNMGGLDPLPSAIILQSNNKIMLLGSSNGTGQFTLNGNTRNSAARLNSNGTEDISFFNTFSSKFASPYSNVPRGGIELEDGTFFIVGGFTRFDGDFSKKYVLRINEDGTEVPGLYEQLGTGFDDSFNGLMAQRSDSLLVTRLSASFGSVDGKSSTSGPAVLLNPLTWP